VDAPASGQQGKRNWLLKNIKLKVGDTNHEGRKPTGKTHSKTTVKLFHYKDLSKTAKAKVDGKSKKSKKS
jgi:hypothetical protein